MKNPTPQNTPKEVIIIGAGLAGTLVAKQLVDQHMEPSHFCLLDAADPLRASNAPGALLHALPGRSLVLDPQAATAFAHSRTWLDPLSDTSMVRKQQMIRTIKKSKIGRRYLNTYNRGQADYPPDMNHAHLTKSQLEHLYPTLASHEGAITYGPAYMVDLPALLSHEQANMDVRHTDVLGIEQDAQGLWCIRTGQTTIKSKRVVMAMGAHLGKWFPELDLTINAGELLIVEPPETTHFDQAVSAGGHLAKHPDGRWVLGATYLHDDELDPFNPTSWLRNDALAQQEITSLIQVLVPNLTDGKFGQVWRGRRAVVQPDRMPLVGRVPEYHELFVLGALGSKGLLWAPYLANELVQTMFNPRHKLPARADIARLDTSWTMKQK